jgi:hypothetical protein
MGMLFFYLLILTVTLLIAEKTSVRVRKRLNELKALEKKAPEERTMDTSKLVVGQKAWSDYELKVGKNGPAV